MMFRRFRFTTTGFSKFLRNKAAGASLLTPIVILMGIGAAMGGGALLLNGATSLRDTGSSAADHATSVANSEGIKVVEIRLQKTETGGIILRELVTPPATAVSVDLKSLKLRIESSGTMAEFLYGTELGKGRFIAEVVRDADGSFTEANPLLTQGDLVELWIGLEENGVVVEEKSTIAQVQVSATSTGDSGKKIIEDVFETPKGVQKDEIVRLDLLTRSLI